jgi:DNA segregation ATPase FtsK/SpoIIIE, S-DNA-T family
MANHRSFKDYNSNGGGITVDQQELEENKNTIVATLKNYKIEIAQIKATVGPTVTLYEIVPEAGIRISKIKNLEDDIALISVSPWNTYYCPYSGERNYWY